MIVTAHTPSSTTWQGQPLTILGLSKSGCATARYIQHRGGRCFLSEVLPASPANDPMRAEMTTLGVEIEMGGHTEKCFTHADTVVVSPGIPPTNPTLQQLALSGKEIISEVELAYRESQRLSPPIPWVGITGTNGKTTTTTLISAILETAGRHAPACGNIGLPVLDVLETTQPDVLVVELSSFQLTFSPTLRAEVAVFTNLKPDHLDWHGSLEAYQEAKLKFFTGPQSPAWSVIWARDPLSQRIADDTTGRVLWFDETLDALKPYTNTAGLDAEGNVVVTWDDSTGTRQTRTLFNMHRIQLLGRHNHLNVLASVATACLMGVRAEDIERACLSFAGVEHRLERVATIQGVTFYNDSKATNPDATICALDAFDGDPAILIAGGRDKRGPLEEFVEVVKTRAAHVVLMGEAQERFSDALAAGGYPHVSRTPDLASALQKAFDLAQAGPHPILFSPACASFDAFKNFEERGAVFKVMVHQLAQNPQPLEVS